MIELERHITKLLLDNDCVIIPDFGGFVAHHVDAFFDEEDELFYPPSRTVGFNQQLRLNDSMLVQSYVETMDVSYPEALVLIEKDVETIKKQIEQDGYYDFHDIGTLHRTSENGFSFEPNEAGLLTPSLYGLSTYDISPIAIKAIEKDEDSTVEDSKKPVLTIKEDSNEEIEDDVEEAKFSISYSSLRYLAAACLLGVLLMLFPLNIGDDPSVQLLKSKLDTNVITNILPKDVKMDANNTLLSKKKAAEIDSTRTKQIVKKSTSEADTTVKTPKTYYTIVLASKVSKKNANAFADYLHKNGYEEAKILPMGKYAKVVYKEFETKNEAYNQLNKITDNIEFADAWVSLIKQ